MPRLPSLLLSCVLLGAPTSWGATSPEPAATAAATAPTTAPVTFSLGALPDESGVAALLWERSPEFAQASERLALAQAELVRARLLPNPELDLSWNTLPLGPTNPPGLDRLRDVPNYQVGLSQLIELGKRGPRQDATRAGLAATALELQAQLRERTYDVLERAAQVAAAEVRLAQLRTLTADAARLTELQRARQKGGDTAGLDVDRAVLEEAQLQGQLAEEQARLSQALLECSQTVGLACAPFESGEAAAAFLASRLTRPATEDALLQRPDLRALEAQHQEAQASLTLARRGWVPDPTVRAGYVHDRFIESGNQRDSVFVGVSMPLPVFNRGQADAFAARAQLESARRTREQRTAQARRDEQTLQAQRTALEARRERVRQQNLPLASSLVTRLDAAVKAGGASLQDLLFARRTYGQLLLDAAELDLSAFRLSVALDRVRATGPTPPTELSENF